MKNIRIMRVLIFLSLTFLLSWGFDWLIIYSRGLNTYRNLGMSPWGMLVPAFVALILQIFFFKDSQLYYQTYKEKPRWILFGFLTLTILYGTLTLISVFSPGLKQIFQGVGLLFFTLWTLLIFFINGQSSYGAFDRAGLKLGDVKFGQWLILGIIVFFFIQAGLNLLLHLGDFIGYAERIYGLPIPPVIYVPSIIILFISVTVIGLPLSSLALVFGEEYGWRGFLQSELIKYDTIRGVLVVGLIWGIWHFPVILRGIHTYPPSSLGLFLGVIFFVLWGIIQGYAVLKTGSIWIAAFMHGVVNSVYSFVISYIAKPNERIFSFGLGIYGLVCLVIIVYFILWDPIWKREAANFNSISKIS